MSKKSKKSKAFYKKWWFKWPLRLLFFAGLSLAALYGSIYFGFWGEIPSENQLLNLSTNQATIMYDKNEEVIGKYYLTNRESIHYDDLPSHLINALVATEDVRFFSHSGTDTKSLLRVFFKSILMKERSAGGGSTITQQLAKNLFPRERHRYISLVVNKIKEDIIARKLESVYSKEEILTLYLNTVPFSGNTYGIESAARKFFQVSTPDLNLLQAATLVGTLKANHTYNPRLFPEASKQRRNVVISQMVKYDYLTEEEGADAMLQELSLNYQSYNSSDGVAPYFREQVLQLVKKILEEEGIKKKDGSTYAILQDGLQIYTTLDAKMQEYAESAMKAHLTRLQRQFEQSYKSNPPWSKSGKIIQKEVKKLSIYKKLKTEGLTHDEIMDSLSKPKETAVFKWEGNEEVPLSTLDSLAYFEKFLNTGMISLDPHSGAVLSYIGGIDYRYFQYDHVSQSKRQVGSVFKPFVYTAALENGYEPCDYFSVKEVKYVDEKGWKPSNSGHDEEEEEGINYSMNAALSQSLNTVAVKVLRETGIPEVIQQVKKMGIDEKLENKPSIALGVSSIRMIDLAKAYSSFLNNGSPVTPFLVTSIRDKEGNIIYEHHAEKRAPEAMSEKTRLQMLAMMRNVVNKGTASRLRNVYRLKNDFAGKTGTTQNNADGWFVGLLPDLVTITWVGNDNQNIKFRSTAMGQGANSALPIYAKMIQGMNKDARFNALTKQRFNIPSDIAESLACPPTSKDGFFKRLFNKEKDEQNFDKSKEKKKKKGFFQRLFN